jgi:hypothetical protein
MNIFKSYGNLKDDKLGRALRYHNVREMPNSTEWLYYRYGSYIPCCPCILKYQISKNFICKSDLIIKKLYKLKTLELSLCLGLN